MQAELATAPSSVMQIRKTTAVSANNAATGYSFKGQ